MKLLALDGITFSTNSSASSTERGDALEGLARSDKSTVVSIADWGSLATLEILDNLPIFLNFW